MTAYLGRAKEFEIHCWNEVPYGELKKADWECGNDIILFHVS